MGLAASHAAVSGTRKGAQIVANSFRNSSSKNCFPSILLQFRFIYYLAVSKQMEPLFSRSCLKETHCNRAAGSGADLWALCPRSQGRCPFPHLQLAERNTVWPDFVGCHLGRCHRCRHVTWSKTPYPLPSCARVEVPPSRPLTLVSPQ